MNLFKYMKTGEEVFVAKVFLFGKKVRISEGLGYECISYRRRRHGRFSYG